jgi:hypothetical protein
MRWTIVVAATMLAVAGCGGGDDSSATTDAVEKDPQIDGTAPDAAPTATTSVESDMSNGDTAGDSGAPPSTAATAPASDLAENTAVVTIGDVRLEFDVTPGSIQRCDPDFFGAFWAIATQQDGGLELLLPPDGDPNFEDPPSMKVRDDGSGLTWVADPATNLPGVEPGQSQIDTFTVDGNHATGTATLVEEESAYASQNGGTIETVTGTFEVLCAPA